MEASKAILDPSVSHGDRVLESDPFPVVGSTDELHAGPFAKVDGRHGDHGDLSPRAWSAAATNRRPAAPLFSG
jgi:hypothetical protein